MLRPLALVALFLFLVHPAAAQQPADKDDLNKLRAEVEKLRTQVKELEAKVTKLQAEQPKAEEPKKRPGKKGNIDLDQIKKLTERFKGQAGKKGNIDIEQLMKLAEILGNNNVDLSQIMKLMELQKGKKPADKRPEEKKPEEKPKLPGGATSTELEVLSLESRTPQAAVWQRRLPA